MTIDERCGWDSRILLPVGGLLLFATVAVPSLGRAFGASMALGTLLISWMYIFFAFALFAIHRPPQKLGNLALLVFTVLVIVFVHGALIFLINDSFNFDRFWQSFLLLIVYFLGAISFTLLTQRFPKLKVNFVIRFVFYALLLNGLAGTFKYSPFFSGPIPVLFFPENSRFALEFLPFLLYMVVASGLRMKWFLLFIGILFALLLKSFTLLVGVCLIAAIATRLRGFVYLVLTVAILFVSFDTFDMSYYSSRMDLSTENQNLSALVFMQGWERAYLNFKESFGAGVGFQQLGFVGSRGEIMSIMSTLGAEDLNLLDGGSLASKLISEFGIFALMILIVYLVYFVKKIKWLHAVSMRGIESADSRDIFFSSCFVMFAVDFFIRGNGYFTSSGFLFLASLVCMVFGEPTGAVPRVRVTKLNQNNESIRLI